jgi:hypothetical protein
VKYELWSRARTVVNTDPQRRCYNGCNFSERVELGEWKLFGVYDQREHAETTMRVLKCERYEYEIRP